MRDQGFHEEVDILKSLPIPGLDEFSYIRFITKHLTEHPKVEQGFFIHLKKAFPVFIY